MKILLIYPTYYSSMSLGLSYAEPLGLAYIAAAILQDGKHEVEILDSVGLAEDFTSRNDTAKYRIGLEQDALFRIMAEKQFDVIGITIAKLYTADYEQNSFIAGIKAAYPKIPIIVGGPEVTLEWDKYITGQNIDYIVLGEGEKTIVELLDAISAGGGFDQVDGIVYRTGEGKIIETKAREPLDIENISYPARHLLPMKNYFRFRPGKYYMRKPAASMLTSRACPFGCAFCNEKTIWGRKWRGRTPESVVDEIQHMISEYEIREILIQDVNFLADPRRAEAICDEIISRKRDISLHVQPGFSIWLLNKELVNKLKQCGLYVLCAQIETGSQKALRYINKNIDFDHVREIMRYANRAGLWTQTNIILGFHFETRQDIEESIRFAESLHIDQIKYFPLRVLRHTKVYDDFLSEGLIQPDIPFTYPVGTQHLSSEDILGFVNKANKSHLFKRMLQIANPIHFYREILTKLNSVEKIKFFCRRIFG